MRYAHDDDDDDVTCDICLCAFKKQRITRQISVKLDVDVMSLKTVPNSYIC